jgi:DNA-dependent RNA polymerase auxiliary subunit epsilon
MCIFSSTNTHILIPYLQYTDAQAPIREHTRFLSTELYMHAQVPIREHTHSLSTVQDMHAQVPIREHTHSLSTLHVRPSTHVLLF